MLGVVFFSQFSPTEMIVFDKIFLYSIKDIDFLSSNDVKKIFYFQLFFVKLWGLKVAKLAMFWTKLCTL